MRNKFIAGGAFSAALLFSAQTALAQTVVWDITPEQERTVYTTIYGSRTVGVAPTREFDVTVGTALPADVELYEVPAAVTYEPVRRYRYVTQGNRLIFVEPGSRRVVRVITP